MLGLGIDLGLGFFRVIAALATLSPGAAWTGVAGSGYAGAPPVDPVRTIAKPAARFLSFPNEVFIADQKVIIDAEAFGGIQKVRFYCEGNTVDVTTPQTTGYTDANGVERTLYGYSMAVNYAACNAVTASGTVSIYAEVFCNNGTFQNRVIGPWNFHNRTALYSVTRTVAPTGADHTTIAAALDYVATNFPAARNALIQINTNGGYKFTRAAVTYNNATHQTTIAAAPGVTASITSGISRGEIRPFHDGLRFKGAGIVFDQAKFQFIYTESTGNLSQMYFDGITYSQTGGRHAMFDGMEPDPGWIYPSTGGATTRLYYRDCVANDCYSAYWNADILNNCTATDLADDFMRNPKSFQNVTLNGLDPATVNIGLNFQVLALNLTYSGGGVAKVAVSGLPTVSPGTTRTLQLYVDAVAFGAALTLTNPTYVSGAYTGSITALILNVTAKSDGTAIAVGHEVVGPGITAGTRIAALDGTGTGGTGTYTVNITQTAASTAFTTRSGFTTWADVAAHIIAQGGGFGATVNGAAGTRRAVTASKAGNSISDMANGSGREITFTAGAATMTSIFDIHGDGLHIFGTVSNVVGRFAKFLNINSETGCQAVFLDHSTTNITDMWLRNCITTTDGKPTVANSQWHSFAYHCGIIKSTFYDQPFLLRTDLAAASKFNPDAYCSFSDNSLFSLAWQGGATDADLLLNRNNVRSSTLPVGSTNSTSATTNLYVGAPSDLAPVTGGNLLNGAGYMGALLPGGGWNI